MQLQVMAEGLDVAATDAEIPDQRLALMFACAHPAIEASIRELKNTRYKPQTYRTSL
jgi:predicted RNA polymerase sigma factor